MSVGTIAQVDPSVLTIALNVRTDAKVNKEFVASIKQLGILQPPMVTLNADGGYDVVLGQRRVLAAVEAGLGTIPVYVVDQSEADAARVVDQLTENDQRQGLSEVERVAGYKQLSLFGVSPAQIAKRTATDRKRIDTALAVADNETATAALQEHELTLDEAAYLVEFSDDAAAVKKLVTAAGAGQLVHVVVALRKSRALVELVAALEADLVAEKVIPMEKATSQYRGASEGDPDGLKRIDGLGKPGAPTEPLQVSDVPKKALAGRVVQDWMQHDGGYGEWAVKQYFVLNPAEHGIPDLEHSRGPSRELTPEEQEERAARETEQRAADERAAALDAATEVRRAWLVEFLQRKKLPEVLQFIARASFRWDAGYDLGTCELLAIPMPDDADDDLIRETIVGLLEADPKRAERVLLAAYLTDIEGRVSRTGTLNNYYGPTSESVVLYLPQLVEWGYGLSDAEQGLLTESTLVEAAMLVDDDDDDYDDEGEDVDGDETDDAA